MDGERERHRPKAATLAATALLAVLAVLASPGATAVHAADAVGRSWSATRHRRA